MARMSSSLIRPFHGVMPVPGRPVWTTRTKSASLPLNAWRFEAAGVPLASVPWHCEHCVRNVDRAARSSGLRVVPGGRAWASVILERADAADTRGDHDLAHDIVRRGQAQPGLVVHEARGDGKAHDEVAPTLVELPEHDDLPRGGNPVDRQLRLERRRDGAGDLDLEARLPGVPTGERQVRRIRAQPEPPNLAGAARGRDQDDRDHEPPQYSHSLSPKTTTTSLKFSLVA